MDVLKAVKWSWEYQPQAELQDQQWSVEATWASGKTATRKVALLGSHVPPSPVEDLTLADIGGEVYGQGLGKFQVEGLGLEESSSDSERTLSCWGAAAEAKQQQLNAVKAIVEKEMDVVKKRLLKQLET